MVELTKYYSWEISMKNDKIFLNMLRELNLTSGVVSIEWQEFLEALNLNNMAVRDIKKDTFDVLMRSKTIAKYYQNLQLETIKFSGRGNKIQKLIVSFLTENIDEATRNFNKNSLIEKLKNNDFKKYSIEKQNEKAREKLQKEKERENKKLEKIQERENKKLQRENEKKVKKEILVLLKKEKILKYSDVFCEIKNKFGTKKNELSQILNTLKEQEKIFIFVLQYDKGNKFLSIKNDKFAVMEFSEKQKQKYFYANSGIEFLKSFCYKASMNSEPLAYRFFLSKLQRAIKENFDLFFDFTILENIIEQKFIIWSANKYKIRYFSFYKNCFSKDELKSIKENSKKWKFSEF